MIPILFDKSATNFDTNGLGRLSDCTRCEVTEERNGGFELEMEYPTSGVLYDKIATSCIILATFCDTGTPQPFSIYQITAPLGGIVTIYAEHISYRLNHVPTSPQSSVTTRTASQALALLNSSAIESHPFTFWTDKTNSGVFDLTVPTSIRSKLGGSDGSILDIYGGEYEYDRYQVKLHASRGSDNGITLRYGKNITDIKQETDIQNTITGLVGYWASSDGSNKITAQPVYTSTVNNFPYHRTAVLDCSQYFENAPTQAQLQAYARTYISTNNIGVPNVDISVSFVDLASTEEYKDIAILEHVKLCDKVTVQFEPLGISTKAKVIKTNYDVLLDRYINVDIGTITKSFSSAVQMLTAEATRTAITKEVANATTCIIGGTGGCCRINLDANGKPFEFLVMDDEDINLAQRVWRWNVGGFGYSSTGYSGTYGTAITMDGSIVADYITSGTINADLITSGTINADLITSGTINADLITSGTISADIIKGGTLTVGGQEDVNGTVVVLDEYGADLARLNGAGLWARYGRFSEIDSDHLTVYATREHIGCYSLIGEAATGNNLTCGAFIIERDDPELKEFYAHLDIGNSNGYSADFPISARGDTGNITCVSLTQTSSRKVKKNIKAMTDDEARKVLELEPIIFDFKEEAQGTGHRGFIAEDVAEVIPQIVASESEEHPASINYTELIPYLTKMIQLQQAEIEALKADIATLKGENNATD